MGGEWRTYRLGELGRIVTGRTPPGTQPDSFGGSIPFLTPTDMDGRRKVETTARSLSAKGANLLEGSVIPHGVAVSCIGWQMGKALLIDRPAITHQQINSIITRSGLVDDLFLFYALLARRQQFFALGAGGTRTPILKKSEFAQVEVSLPDLGEQRAIAHILGTLDDKIELNRRMSETLEAMARALFKSWFVDFDPVRAKVEGRWRPGQSLPGLPAHLYDLFPDLLVESELGEIPEGWEVVLLTQLLEVNPKRPLKRQEVAPYLSMSNMPTQGHTPEAVEQRAYGSGMRFMNGDTLFARITPCLENGKAAYVDFLEDGEVGWGSTEYIVLRPKPPLPEEFAYCLARSDGFRDFAIQRMTGSSGRQRVSASALEHFLLAVPLREPAERFGELVRPLFERSSQASNESRSLAALRDTLLPKLVSGELRVNEASQLVESTP